MDKNSIKTYKAIILLNEIISNKRVFKTIMNGDDTILEDLFVEMLAKSYVDIDGEHYIVTETGQAVYDSFMNRYFEYLKVYDIYCAVDTELGEFAFEKMFEYEDEVWTKYKNLERFYDLRIPVAIFKKIDPHDLAFMSFINDNRFDTNKSGWQFDLISNNIWNEIEKLVKDSVTIEDLGGNETMVNLIKKGTEVMFDLFKKEIAAKKEALEEAKKLQAVNVESVDEEFIIETTTTIEEYEEDIIYYGPYNDPYYCNPIWFAPLFYW